MFCALEKLVPLGFSFPTLATFRARFKKVSSDKKSLSKSKNRSEQELAKYNNFLVSSFFPENSSLPVSNSCSSAVCQGFKLQVQTLEREKRSLEQKVDDLDSTLLMEKSHSSDLAARVSELESSNDKLTQKIRELESDISHYQKKVAGMKSGKARLEKKTATETPQDSKCSHNSNGFGFISITSENFAGNSSLFEGVRHFDCQTGTKKSGKPVIFAKLHIEKKSSDVCSKVIGERSDLSIAVMGILSGASQEQISTGDLDVFEVQYLTSRIISKNKDLFDCEKLRSAGVELATKLSPRQAVNLKTTLRLPMTTIRTMRLMLSNFGLNIMPSEGSSLDTGALNLQMA